MLSLINCFNSVGITSLISFISSSETNNSVHSRKSFILLMQLKSLSNLQPSTHLSSTQATMPATEMILHGQAGYVMHVAPRIILPALSRGTSCSSATRRTNSFPFTAYFSRSSDMKFYFLDFEVDECSISKLSLAVIRYSTILLLFTIVLWS
jgi:hypothetical protein